MDTLNIATFNIRYDNPMDGVNAWPNRREWVRDLIDYHEFDIVGIQEALAHQIDFLGEKRLAFVGVGRDDGKRAGEFSAILYDRKRFERLADGTFWLSPTPDVPSRGWDANLNRICTWARLRDRANRGREFFVFNTHFDHQGEEARRQSADLILRRIPGIAGKKPFVLIGDFNSKPETPQIQRLSSALRNARTVTERKPYGPFGTANGFDIKRPLDTHIDYIFVSPQVRVLKYAVLPDNWELRYPSDHLPVAIRAEIRG
jgi:endonuclease/exonuclease/phosphatase family metal-dependent hydrolase